MDRNNPFFTDNFVCGKFSDELLSSVNPAVYDLLGCCAYYESELKRGISLGQKWIYSNSSAYCPQNGFFDDMTASGHQGTNCAMPAGWAMLDMGIVPSPLRFWGDVHCGFAHYDQVSPYMLPACEIDHLEKPELFCDLFDRGEIKPGDILLAKGHTFIYMGDDLFLAAGHDGIWHEDESAVTDDPRKAVFDSWIAEREKCFNNRCTVYWRIRLRDGYIPAYYRNREGKLVKTEKD